MSFYPEIRSVANVSVSVIALRQSNTVLLLIIDASIAFSAASELENMKTTLLAVFLGQVLNYFSASVIGRISA
jgi:hypothetical protein